MSGIVVVSLVVAALHGVEVDGVEVGCRGVLGGVPGVPLEASGGGVDRPGGRVDGFFELFHGSGLAHVLLQ